MPDAPDDGSGVRPEPSSRPSPLTDLAPHLPPALENIGFACYVLDSGGEIVWVNGAGKSLLGDVAGQPLTSVIGPAEADTAPARFAERVRAGGREDFEIDLVSAEGRDVRVEISSIPLHADHDLVAIFGMAVPTGASETATRRPTLDARLTPRQLEVLQLLATGASTEQIAQRLYLSRETVRNHVRHILQRLEARSRLEAVAIAHQDGLI